jgi:hypothetical protein
MRVLVVAMLSVMGLAGCSSSPPSSDEAGPVEVVTSTATLSLLPPAEPTTDTMYLLEAPHMTATLPPADPLLRTPVPSVFEGPGAASWAEWLLPRGGVGVLEGNVTLWVEVRGAVVNPNLPFMGNDPCFWSVTLVAYRSDGGYNAVGDCADEPNVVPEGIREIRVEFSAVDISDVQGDTLALWVSNSGIASDGATVEVLAGSPEYPSRLALRGLELPLDTRTLL